MKYKSKFKTKHAISSLLASLFLIFNPIIAHADEASNAYNFLKDNTEYVQQWGIFSWLGHTIGWMVVKGLYTISNGLEGFIDKLFQLFGIGATDSFAKSVNNLFNIGDLDKVYTYMKDVAFAIIIIAIIVIGIWYMVSDKVSLKDTAVRFLLATILIGSSGMFINMSLNTGKAVFDGSKHMFSDTKDNSFTLNIINNNTVDLYKMAKEKQPLTSMQSGDETNYIKPNAQKIVAFKTKESFLRADLTDNIKKKNEALWKAIGNNKELLQYKIVNEDAENVEDRVDKLEGHIIMKGIDEGYFRYGVKFLNLIIQLLLFIGATALTLFVLARHIFNMVFIYILTPLISASDVGTGTKMKRIFGDIIKGGGAIACTGISYSLFIKLFDVISQKSDNILFQLMVMLAAGVACFDGAHAFNKYFDYDTGFKDGFKTFRMGQEIGKGAVEAGKGLAKTAVAGAKGVSEGANTVASVANAGTEWAANSAVKSSADKMMDYLNSEQANKDFEMFDNMLDDKENANNSVNKDDANNSNSTNSKDNSSDELNKEQINNASDNSNSLDGLDASENAVDGADITENEDINAVSDIDSDNMNVNDVEDNDELMTNDIEDLDENVDVENTDDFINENNMETTTDPNMDDNVTDGSDLSEELDSDNFENSANVIGNDEVMATNSNNATTNVDTTETASVEGTDNSIESPSVKEQLDEVDSVPNDAINENNNLNANPYLASETMDNTPNNLQTTEDKDTKADWKPYKPGDVKLNIEVKDYSKMIKNDIDPKA